MIDDHAWIEADDGVRLVGTNRQIQIHKYLSKKSVDHDWVEADDEEKGQEIAKDEETHLGVGKVKGKIKIETNL